jgi:hypothetical protein
VDGRTPHPGSDESRDASKIEAVADFSRALIARHHAVSSHVLVAQQAQRAARSSAVLP